MKKNHPQQSFFFLHSCILFLFLSIFNVGNAQDQSFENTIVPNNWNASTGSLSISTDHYKLDNKSLQWNWTANDVLTVTDLQKNGLVPSEVLGYYENMFRMWVYNTNAVPNQKLEIGFYDNNGIKQFYYEFYTNFTGWRAASASYKSEMSGAKSSSNITTLKIKAPAIGNGTFFFDYVDYTMGRNTYRSPDYQLPFINAENDQHWSDMMYFQSLPKTIPLNTPTPQELADLAKIKNTYDTSIFSNAPGNSAVNKAVTAYNKQNINYSGGIVTGKPLLGTDYSDANTIAVVDDFIYVFARDYKHNNNTNSLTYYLNTIRYLLDQGYANGSLLETLHHVGYRCRNVSKSVHLMKDELTAAGLWTKAQKMVEWLTAVDLIWHPTAHKSNMDDALTRALTILGACLYKDTNAERIQYLKGLQNYFHTWLTPYAKEGTGVKVDYTCFHHNTYYPQYAFGAYKTLSQSINFISESIFQISSEKKDILKKILSVARLTMSKDSPPNSLAGRSPMNDISIASAYKNIGLIKPVDLQLLGAYNYITGGDNQTKSYPTERLPNGFWQINFANLGVYRQSDWVADIKGFNKYFWGTEIYSSDNRYGRYQSYGSIQIMYPDGQENSGFNLNGWNWNMNPGTTSIVLPWNSLKASKSRQDEVTDSNFAASLRFGKKNNYYIEEKLEGDYGMFGMDFTQKAITATHNTSFTFKKSVFCFDGKLICLGSNINNNDNSNKTITPLFQNQLSNTNHPITIDGNSTAVFPYTTTLNKTQHWLVDAYNTGYFVKNTSQIIVDRQNQSSPNENGKSANTSGNFASAYINHGTSPNNLEYEYVIIPKTTSEEMTSFSTQMENEHTAFYSVIQKNANAHIVKHKTLYGYALFGAGNYGDETPLKSNNKPCLVMTQTTGNNLHLSVVNPNLNFGSNENESQPEIISLVLNGNWKLKNSTGGNVSHTAKTNETLLEIELKNGMPVDIELNTKNDESVFYPTFYYEDFRNNSDRGYNVQIVSNPENQDISLLGKVISDIVDNTDSNGEFTETRPENRIPNNSIREQKAISIVGIGSHKNFPLEVWIPMTTLNLSNSNPLIHKNEHKYVSFWTESRYANGGTSSLSTLISTNYTNDVTTATWIDVTPKLNQIAKNDNTHNLMYLKSILDLSSYNNANFTLAFKYVSNNSPFTASNRNGTFYISDVHFFTNKDSLSIREISPTDTSIKVYPNPSNDYFNIQNNDSSVQIKKISINDLVGRVVYSQNQTSPIAINKLSKGLYILTIKTETGKIIQKKVQVY
ncbi:chondroitinase family polysaccharide lyase [Wenyingzhuangia sp. 2_MG-2023]|uniref:chondroitinase family polysaccharide lyase n=1 Tax=Wenyingzhuangia sp. 2_MG-2023 TaxID=3062639 RepID=UPI0026E20A13|nr:chondroitinase family polysaccharide lyase [Wenyingzhuangia sp. 2_MG-2023]MDO6738803.1 chondroitinase family polysaccharide lyase [Wenyingzhuangia sp. 2_MG-2023]